MRLLSPCFVPYLLNFFFPPHHPLLPSIVFLYFYTCSACTSMPSLIPLPHLLPSFSPVFSSFMGSWSTCQASPLLPLAILPLIRSIHCSIHKNIIRWLCMGPALLLLTLYSTDAYTQTHTHAFTHLAPLADGSWRQISLKNSVDVLRQRKLAAWCSPY